MVIDKLMGRLAVKCFKCVRIHYTVGVMTFIERIVGRLIEI